MKRALKTYAVIVIGGGPAGSIAATELAALKVPVALIHQPEPNGRKIGESLPSSSHPLLHRLGIYDLANAEKHKKVYANTSAWGSSQLQTKDFLQDPSGKGWHLDRVEFDRDLRTRAGICGVDVIEGHAHEISKRDGRWTVHIGDTHELTCAFLIDASGRSSVLSRHLNIERKNDDGLISMFKWLPPIYGDNDKTTLIEASSNGWWYTSLLPDRSRVIAYHTDMDIFRGLRTTFPAGLHAAHMKWLADLSTTQHVGRFYDFAAKVKGLQSRPAWGSILSEVAGPGWLACGDAALSFDPISSQGIFNALATGEMAAIAVERLINGEGTALLEYSQKIVEIRNAYLKRHSWVYAAEQRWPESIFWRRRFLTMSDHEVSTPQTLSALADHQCPKIRFNSVTGMT